MRIRFICGHSQFYYSYGHAVTKRSPKLCGGCARHANKIKQALKGPPIRSQSELAKRLLASFNMLQQAEKRRESRRLVGYQPIKI